MQAAFNGASHRNVRCDIVRMTRRRNRLISIRLLGDGAEPFHLGRREKMLSFQWPETSPTLRGSSTAEMSSPVPRDRFICSTHRQLIPGRLIAMNGNTLPVQATNILTVPQAMHLLGTG